MRAVFSPGELRGSFAAPPSKSEAHRAFICAALCDTPTRILMPGPVCDDVAATIDCLRALGADIREEDGVYTVFPIDSPRRAPTLFCGESGSTLRFLLPLAAALGCSACFEGTGRLPERPVGELLHALESGGAVFDNTSIPLRIGGGLKSGTFTLPGDVSSQFISGLLMALPLLPEGGELFLTSPLQSSGYVDMTLSVMERFGVTVLRVPGGWRVPSSAYRSPGVFGLSGDWSSAAFFLAAGALGGGVCGLGLSPESFQPDCAIAALLRRNGAEVTASGNALEVSPGTLSGTGEIDVSETPDLLPVLAVLAALSPGETQLTNAARLRLKESDRLSAASQMLRGLGADIKASGDSLLIRGKPYLEGGAAESFGDHRIAMAAAIASLRCKGELRLSGAEAVQKSYPDFFEEFKRLGGQVLLTD